MNRRVLPNLITCARILLALMLLVWLFYDRAIDVYKFILLVVIVITDFIDGFAARKLNAQTSLGQFLDPLADKIALAGVYVYLFVDTAIDSWFLFAFLIREIIQTYLRFRRYVKKEKQVPTLFVNKVKTGLCYLLALILFYVSMNGESFRWTPAFEIAILVLAYAGWIKNPWFFGLIATLIAPNILFWIIGEKIYLVRGIFVAEYFMIACLLPIVSRKIFVAMWLLFALFDLLVSSTALFFMDFSQMVEAATGIQHFSFWQVLKWIAAISLFVLLSWLLLRFLLRMNSRKFYLKPMYLLSYLFLLLIVDFFNGGNTLNTNYNQVVFNLPVNIVSVPSFSVGSGIYDAVGKKTKHSIEASRSVAKETFWKDDSTEKQMLVLVESWGLLKDSALQQSMTEALKEVATEKGYTIHEGITEFRYLTQISEMRELTGYYTSFAAPDSVFMRKHSLLYEKQKQGYEVSGVHGYGSGFYNRRKWWPELGVQRMYFAEEFTKLDLPFGGNAFFRGAEDTAIIRWIFENSVPGKKEFYYWLTLNTHLPLPERKDENYKDYASKWKNASCDGEIIRLTYQIRELFTQIAANIRGSDSDLRILIVGDHAPPFTDPSKRSCFDPKYVPYIELRR